MVIAWTIGNFRYRFRVSTAAVPLRKTTFWVVTAVGVLTLLSDLWRVQEWVVPQGELISPAEWQVLLGLTVLATFLYWVWVALIRPPTFGRRNAAQYGRALYSTILRGAPRELSVAADELSRSAEALMQFAPERRRGRISDDEPEEQKERTGDSNGPSAYANDILLLIADKRFCRAIVESSPGTALALFESVRRVNKYDVNINTFAKNLVTEALDSRDSFLYHETTGYKSGLLGYHKPVSQAMCSDYRMVQNVPELLEPNWRSRREWKADQWAAYGRLVRLTLRDYALAGAWWHDQLIFHGVFENFEEAVLDLQVLNAKEVDWDEEVLERLRSVVRFVQDVVDILNEAGVPDSLTKRVRETHERGHTVYDQVARLVREIVFYASTVQEPRNTCWWVQHNEVWAEFFGLTGLEGPAGDVIQFKVRRLLYDEIARMSEFPNFKSATILGLCLNVMGLETSQDEDESYRALHQAVLSWTRENYAWLHSFNSRLGEACLVDGMSYDPDENRILKLYPKRGLSRKERRIYLEVDTEPSGGEEPH